MPSLSVVMFSSSLVQDGLMLARPTVILCTTEAQPSHITEEAMDEAERTKQVVEFSPIQTKQDIAPTCAW